MTPKKTRLASLIAAEQIKRGLNERDAAAATGVIQQTFSAWKRGVIPRDNKLAALAATLLSSSINSSAPPLASPSFFFCSLRFRAACLSPLVIQYQPLNPRL